MNLWGQIKIGGCSGNRSNIGLLLLSTEWLNGERKKKLASRT
jgi:hypothetical protein